MPIGLKQYGNILHIKLKQGKKFMWQTNYDGISYAGHTSDPISKKIIYIMLYHINVEKKAIT
jgi:hypothetical protein